MLIVALLIGINFLRHKREFQAEEQHLEGRASAFQLATTFDDTEFATNFETIRRKFAPPPHVVLFWYGTEHEARRALECGVPAVEAFGGIAFTAHRPHALDADDAAAFPEHRREVVLACIVPTRFLKRLHNAVYVLSGEVLSALRGSYLGAITNPNPWLAGELFLPQQQIARAYQLVVAPKNEPEINIPVMVTYTLPFIECFF